MNQIEAFELKDFNTASDAFEAPKVYKPSRQKSTSSKSGGSKNLQLKF